MGKMTIIAHTIRKKYETTFPPNEVSPIFFGSNNLDTCIIFTTDLPVNIYGSRN